MFVGIIHYITKIIKHRILGKVMPCLNKIYTVFFRVSHNVVAKSSADKGIGSELCGKTKKKEA